MSPVILKCLIHEPYEVMQIMYHMHTYIYMYTYICITYNLTHIICLWVGDVEMCQELMTFMILFGFLPHSLVSVLIDS